MFPSVSKYRSRPNRSWRGLLLVGVMFLGSHASVIAQSPAATPADSALSAAQSSAAVASMVSMDALDDRRVLGTGDRLSYRVVEERRSPIPLVVTDSGEVEVPLIGRVSATGKTCRQLAQAIRVPLEREYFYHATVIVGLDTVGVRPRGQIYLSGQVRGQGAQEIPPDGGLTLSKAILKAGGLADFANARKVKIVRKHGSSSETMVVDLEEITKRGHLEKDPVLQAEDVIIVPERLVNF